MLHHHRGAEGHVEALGGLEVEARAHPCDGAERQPPEGVVIMLDEGLGLEWAGERDAIAEVLEILAHEGLPALRGEITARHDEEQVTPSPDLEEAAARERDELGVAVAHVGRGLGHEGRVVLVALLGGDQRLNVDDLRRGGQCEESRRGGEEGAGKAFLKGARPSRHNRVRGAASAVGARLGRRRGLANEDGALAEGASKLLWLGEDPEHGSAGA